MHFKFFFSNRYVYNYCFPSFSVVPTEKTSFNHASTLAEAKEVYVNKLKVANGLSELKRAQVGFDGMDSFKCVTDCAAFTNVREEMTQKAHSAEEKAMKGVSNVN